jgi:hypothetical protein
LTSKIERRRCCSAQEVRFRKKKLKSLIGAVLV